MATKVYSGKKYIGTDSWKGSASLKSKPYTPPGDKSLVSGRKGTPMKPAAVAARKKTTISNAASKVMGGLTSK